MSNANPMTGDGRMVVQGANCNLDYLKRIILKRKSASRSVTPSSSLHLVGQGRFRLECSVVVISEHELVDATAVPTQYSTTTDVQPWQLDREGHKGASPYLDGPASRST
jgi:citrate lyase synthetase